MATQNDNGAGDDRGLNGQAPTLDQQIATFKGASSTDGVLDGVQDGLPRVADEDEDDDKGGEKGGEKGGAGADGELKVITAPPKPRSAQERINQAVRSQRAAERALEAERSTNKAILDRLERLEKGGQSTPLTNAQGGARTVEVDPTAPDPSKYQFGDMDSRYIADLARHTATKAFEERDKAQATARQTEAAKAASEKFEAARDKLVEDGTSLYPDFKEVVIDAAFEKKWPLSQTVGELAFESEVGPAILYHLATNPSEAVALDKLTPAQQAKWFGKTEAALAAQSAKSTAAADGERGQPTVQPGARPTQAPPPPARQVRGNGNPNPVSPDTTDFAAFERLAQSGRQH